jgi:zinc protease
VTIRIRLIGTLAALCVAAASTSPVQAQEPSVRDALAALRFEPVEFEPPVPEHHEVDGVSVLLLEDRTLPLVGAYARFRGGYGRLAREWYAPAFGLPTLLRYGGTATLAPDSVDAVLDFYAVQTSFGTGGGTISATIETLTEHLDVTMELWTDLLTRPGFDKREIELWRDREMESARRRADDPSSLAYAEFNRLLYGDHPVGWELGPEDLADALVAPARFADVHRRIVCRENLMLGVAGDVSWSEMRPFVERLVARLAPCPGPLPEAAAPDIRREPGVFLIEREIEQAVVVMAHPASVRFADDPTYFAATIGNWILGAGGFSSRLLARVRTEQGYAYGASSLWTMPRRYDGVMGAVTSTRPENVAPAIRLILATMEELRSGPPTEAELRTAVDGVVNGFVFNFETPGQIVSRVMLYLAEDMPEDWLERYARGIQRVTPGDVQRVFAEHVRPSEMTILVVGDLDRIGLEALEDFGPVTRLQID